MTQATAREALAARVRKLSQMTPANGCSESEATFAAQRIAEIMAEHALTQDELSIKEDALHCIKDEFILFGQEVGDWGMLQGAIARHYGCKHWYERVRIEEIEELGIGHPVRPFKFYGTSYDVVACIATMGICYQAVASAAEKERRKRADFGFGMVSRLVLRISELRAKNPTGSALISLKDQLVAEEFAKLNMGIRHVKRAVRNLDPQAVARGFAAGAHVDIHGGRNATPQAVRPRQIARQGT